MERYVRHNYNDRWKKFMKRSLRNIDYFTYGLTEDKVIEEITYLLEMIDIKHEDYLFKTKDQWKNIYMISNGEIEIYVNNNGKDHFIDTLYAGCTIGSYGVLKLEDYTINAKAKTDWTLLKLSYDNLLKIRDKYQNVDEICEEYEQYIYMNGMPYCDYKLHRNRHHRMNPIEKFKNWVHRIIRIGKIFVKILNFLCKNI